MRALVIGHKGMLGSDLAAELAARSHAVQGVDLPDFDITHPEHCARIAATEFGELEWVFNCAAYTAVDKAETERDLAFMVNGLGPGFLAQACSMKGVKLMHVSTDFVFDGKKEGPYVEVDEPNPLGAYGESKLMGERSVLAYGAVVVRTAWLFGPNGGSFPRTMIEAWKAEKALRVVSDQIGSPTYTADLARVIADLGERSAYPGLYHAAGPEAMTWHELAVRSIRAWEKVHPSGRSIDVAAIRSEDWPTPAARPRNSVLACGKLEELGIEPMRPLDEALDGFVRRLGE